MADRPVALITGCGKPDGMGQGIARAFAREGYAVVVSDRDAQGVANDRAASRSFSGGSGVDGLVAELTADGVHATALLADISDRTQARELVQNAHDISGRLDVLVNNAAAPQGDDRVDIEEVSEAAWHLQLAVNLTGTFYLSQAAVPFMRARRFGRIVNISSQAGVSAAPMAAAYSASKAGVIGLTRSLAMDLAPWGITVNAICPGLVDTSRALLNAAADADPQQLMAERGKRIQVGRVGTPADVAALAVFLASEQAGYLTAEAIGLHGGGMSPFPVRRPPEA